MSKNNFVSNVASCCSAALISLYPVVASSNSSYNQSTDNTYIRYNLEKTSSMNSNTQKEVNIPKNIDIYEREANAIVSEIKSRLNILVDDKFIPNKYEDSVTLFITCEEFRKLCDREKYDEAYQLEMKISSLLSEQLSKFKKIERIAFL